LGVIPMSLFSGVFFPVESLPGLLRWFAYVLPLWHGVDLSRATTLGVAPEWSATGHLLCLAAWAGAGWWVAYRQFRRRLVV
jgi:lipooligosaccharide transport system permease protein